jgi:hypothetical protein
MFVEEKPLVLPRAHPIQPRTAEDVLLAAARLIEERGWSATGHKYHNHGPVCPIEAIGEVTREQPIRDEAFRLLGDHIGREAYPRTRDYIYQRIGIVRWNERSTEDEVIATMRAVAKSSAHYS